MAKLWRVEVLTLREAHAETGPRNEKVLTPKFILDQVLSVYYRLEKFSVWLPNRCTVGVNLPIYVTPQKRNRSLAEINDHNAMWSLLRSHNALWAKKSTHNALWHRTNATTRCGRFWVSSTTRCGQFFLSTNFNCFWLFTLRCLKLHFSLYFVPLTYYTLLVVSTATTGFKSERPLDLSGWSEQSVIALQDQVQIVQSIRGFSIFYRM